MIIAWLTQVIFVSVTLVIYINQSTSAYQWRHLNIIWTQSPIYSAMASPKGSSTSWHSTLLLLLLVIFPCFTLCFQHWIGHVTFSQSLAIFIGFIFIFITYSYSFKSLDNDLIAQCNSIHILLDIPGLYISIMHDYKRM